VEWKAELPALPGVDWGAFSRGLVAAASFRSSLDIADHFNRAFAAAPIETIRLVHCRPGMLTSLVRSSGFVNVRVVNAASGYVTDDELDGLAANPAAARLEELSCGGVQWETRPAASANGWERVAVPTVTDRAAAALAESPHLASLRSLWVRDGGFTADGVARLTGRFGAGAANNRVGGT